MPGIRLLCLVLALLGAALATSAHGDAPSEEPVPPPDRLDWWREARFGLFIHWGLYAIPAGRVGRGRRTTPSGSATTAQIPRRRRTTSSPPQFNPVKFDADDLGAHREGRGHEVHRHHRKHHDGFCLWDSTQTDCDVMAHALTGGTSCAELADACRKHGLRICCYHSIMDWHHPDYLPAARLGARDRPEGDADFDRYVRLPARAR